MIKLNKRIAIEDHHIVQGNYISPIVREILKSVARQKKINPTKLASQILSDWAITAARDIIDELTKGANNEKEKSSGTRRKKKAVD